ncbi:MAG: GGDEF domain-containing protein, partial [Aquificota bacterium]
DNTVGIYSSSFWTTYITTNIIIFLLLTMSFFLSYIKEKILIDEMEEKDELEDVYDKTFLKTFLFHEIERAKRYDRPISLLAIDFLSIKDLDEEKKKEALKSISGILKENIRKVDFLFILDDSLFVIVLPETDIQEAGKFAERLKEILEHIYIEDLGKPSFNIGITEVTFDDTPEKALKRLKEVLYLAEEKGKNTIEMSAV